ncbi:MAG TPA: hypothetical protein VMU22_10290 [Rhizomicrobium sp.]|nr:hypothetical protein [Rhizomicrobium sp.]
MHGARHAPLQYQQQDSPQTLAEALAEYYRVNDGVVTRPADLPPESKALFVGHDTGHVIFGLSTSLEDEAMADTRILLSSDVGFWRYSRYLAADQQAKAIFKQVGYGRVLLYSLRATPRILRAIWEAMRTGKRWPWAPPSSFQTRSLADLRREFGIRVI